VSSNGGKLLNEFYCKGVVATAVSLINRFGGAMREVLNEGSCIQLWKKYDITVSLNTENDTKVAELGNNFDIPTTALTTVSKNKSLIRLCAKTK